MTVHTSKKISNLIIPEKFKKEREIKTFSEFIELLKETQGKTTEADLIHFSNDRVKIDCKSITIDLSQIMIKNKSFLSPETNYYFRIFRTAAAIEQVESTKVKHILLMYTAARLESMFNGETLQKGIDRVIEKFTDEGILETIKKGINQNFVDFKEFLETFTSIQLTEETLINKSKEVYKNPNNISEDEKYILMFVIDSFSDIAYPNIQSMVNFLFQMISLITEETVKSILNVK